MIGGYIIINISSHLPQLFTLHILPKSPRVSKGLENFTVVVRLVQNYHSAQSPV